MAHATLECMTLHPMNLWWHQPWVHSMDLHWFESKFVSITQTNVKRICTSPFGTLWNPKVLGSNPMVFMWNSWWLFANELDLGVPTTCQVGFTLLLQKRRSMSLHPMNLWWNWWWGHLTKLHWFWDAHDHSCCFTNNTNQSTSLPPLTQLLPINHFLLWPIVAFWHSLIGNKLNYHLKIVSNVQLLSGQWCEVDYIHIFHGHLDYISMRSDWKS
jgi:hypothetical protein